MLGGKWGLRTPWRPWLSEKAGRMNQSLTEYIKSHGKVLSSLRRHIVLAAPMTLDITAHSYQPGDYLQTWTEEPLQEKWKGPYQVVLTINTGVKVQEVDLWLLNLGWLKQLFIPIVLFLLMILIICCKTYCCID